MNSTMPPLPAAPRSMTYGDFVETVVTSVEGNSDNDIEAPVSDALHKGLYAIAKVVTLDELRAILDGVCNDLEAAAGEGE